MILKGKTHNIEILIKSKKASQFEDMVCKDNENLLSILPQKAMGKGKIDFLVDLLSHFQVGQEKLPKDSEDGFDLYDFIDEYNEVNECSTTDLFRKIIEQFDVAGVIDKGMGFQISRIMGEAMQKAMEEMSTKNIEKALEKI